jgi:hypothetical protein
MEIRKAGEFVRRSTKFLSGDWLDPSFDMLFPNHQWIGNNTLLLYRDQYRQDTALDTVEVINSSDITVRYLGIRSQDCAIPNPCLWKVSLQPKRPYLIKVPLLMCRIKNHYY